MTESLLKMNTHNRPVKKSVVSRYVRDMKNGQWDLTCQGIGVSECGVLVDGQHRLIAHRESGYPVIDVVLVTGLNMESQKLHDQHTKRDARDIFRLAFSADIARVTPAILQVLAKFDTGVHEKRGLSRQTLSISEMYNMFDEYADSIEAVCDNLVERTFFPAPVLAACVNLYHAELVTKDQAREFLHQVRTGENLNRTMPTYHLRNLIMTTRKMGAGTMVQKERYEKSIKALKAFASGESMGVLRA